MGNLEQVFGFISDDLTYNAIQELSPTQRRQLWLKPLKLLPIVGLLLLMAMLADDVNLAQVQTILYLFLAFFGMNFIWQLMKAWFDTGYRVDQVEGKFFLKISVNCDGDKSYFLNIGMERFQLTHQQYEVLETLSENNIYRVYYTLFKRIVAIELIKSQW